MFLGHEQIHNPECSFVERAYIALFGVPVIGLRIRARNVFSLIPKGKRYQSILDAGSGSGVLSFELGRRFPGARVLGVDRDSEAVEVCNHIATKVNVGNVAFRRSDILDLKEEGAFDLVICIDILEHIEDDMAALLSLRRMLSSNGTLLLHVPALYRRYPIWKKSLNFDVPTHVRAGYLMEGIVNKLIAAGYSVIESGYTYGFWETLANNVSYMITRARKENKILYALAFPILNIISLVGAKARPRETGAGIFVIAAKGV